MSKILMKLLGLVPQERPADPAQVPNNAGGYTFTVPPLKQLERFLVLGTEGGTYYATAAEHTAQNLEMVRAVLAASPREAVELIVRVSRGNLAVKADPTLAALAVALRSDVVATRALAYAAFAEVVRTGAHLLQIVGYLKQSGRGMSSGLRRVVHAWYASRSGHDLAYQLLKYQQRNGWSQRDVLRLAKPRPAHAWQDAALAFAAGKDWHAKGLDAHADDADAREVRRMLDSYARMRAAKDAPSVATLIVDERLPHECVPSQWRTDARVWRALLKDMPYHALLRNLSTLARVGVTEPHDIATIIERLARPQGTRVHPIQILLAAVAYKLGRGLVGKSRWTPDSRVSAALDDAFYAAYGEVEPLGLRLSISVDASASMEQHAVTGLSHREVAAALAAVLAARDPTAIVRAFTCDLSLGQWSSMSKWGSRTTLTDLDVRKRRIDDICASTRALPVGGTDCALPMLDALHRREAVDLFVIITDNETWAGNVHPHVALQDYRRKLGIDAKLVVLATTATPFTIADPKDPGMLDVVGFSADVPQAIRAFARG